MLKIEEIMPSISRLLIILIIIISIAVSISCRQINQNHAIEYYDKHVKNFPEESP